MSGVLEVNTDLPIKTDQPVHFGKVRAVYWLTADDSARLIKEKNYDVAPDSSLAVMVISDRISAFDCIWKGEGGLNGVPGKVMPHTCRYVACMLCGCRTVRVIVPCGSGQFRTRANLILCLLRARCVLPSFYLKNVYTDGIPM